MPKNVQITIQLHSFHMPARFCSKSFKLGFSGTWTKNFQMYKLDLEKAEEPEIKLPTSEGLQKKQGSFRKTSTSASLTILKHLTVWITTNWKILQELATADHLTCLLRNLHAGQEPTVSTGHGTTDWFQTGKKMEFCIKNIGVGCHFHPQGTFPTQGLKLGLPHWRQTL